ncbi:MAG TPA: hypothetical protein VJP07_10365 [Dehalococcoidia bacterium]|nr:hypothetical protein [Dehalococcoidia bacterium]
MHLIHIEADGVRATIAPEAGGRLLQLEIRDGDATRPLLLAPDDPAALRTEPLAWGCYPMVPWPGRMEGARFTWDGRACALAANDGPHAIHGAGVYAAWTVDSASRNACRLGLELSDPWPFPGRAVHEIRLSPGEIVLRLELHATGGVVFPGGLGWHPWFRRDVVPGEDPRVRLEATDIYETRPDLIPTGRLLPVAGEADLREGPALGVRGLDCCYRGVRGPAAVRWGALELTMASSPNVGHAVVHTPERKFCIEPQTCAPDTFNLAARGVEGSGIATVRPGAPLTAETRWSWRRI